LDESSGVRVLIVVIVNIMMITTRTPILSWRLE
jgi:hypothetical protein